MQRTPSPRASRTLETRVLVTVIGGLAALVLADRTGSAWLLLLAGVAAGVTVDALLERGGLDQLNLTLHAPRRGRVGEPLQLAVRVVGSGRRPSPAAVIGLTTGSGRAGGLTTGLAHVGPLGPGQVADVVLTVVPDARGRYDQLVLTVTSSGSLGLLRHKATLVSPARLVIRPAIVTPARLDAISTSASTASASTNRAGRGLDVLGVRDWRPGDDTARVHWRTTARRGTPVVLERQHEQAPAVVVCVVGDGPGPAWESLVALACATTVAALARGDRLRVVLLGAAEVRVEAPTSSPDDLLDWWATVTAAGLPMPEAIAALAGATGSAAAVVVACSTPDVLGVSGRSWWQQVVSECGPDVQVMRAPASSSVTP